MELRGHHSYTLLLRRHLLLGVTWAEHTLRPLPARHTYGEDSVSTPEECALEVHRSERSVQATSKQACTCPGTDVTHLVGKEWACAQQSHKRRSATRSLYLFLPLLRPRAPGLSRSTTYCTAANKKPRRAEVEAGCIRLPTSHFITHDLKYTAK